MQMLSQNLTGPNQLNIYTLKKEGRNLEVITS